MTEPTPKNHRSGSGRTTQDRTAHSDGASFGLTRRRALAGGALGVFSAAVLSACSGNDQASKDSSASASPSKTFTPQVTVTPEANAKEVNPVVPVSVTTAEGRMSEVEITGGKEDVKGHVSEDGKTWTSDGDLEFDTNYTIKYKVTGDKGEHESQSSFATVVAANEADAKLNVQEGKTYGTGQVIQFDFSEPVTNKGDIEKSITVTGGGAAPGLFRWYSDTMVRYRPQDLWAPNSEVTIEANILGKDLGNGQIGNQNYKVTFKIGEKHYAFVDNNTKSMKMYVNDNMVREAPVTLGSKDWPSVTGKLVILEQAKKYKFDAKTLGLKKGDEHWYEPFEATNTSRLTNSGAFVHQAEPSAYNVVGVANISHGCIGLLPDDAEFFFDTFEVGDIVETQNTDYGQANPDNGYGDWNIPWEHYTDTSWHGNW
ncbi:MAG: Ig-like domain-containing protein [Kocuria sp.]|nr:Ig-like domain-containing protein [Kocuria sp.]MDN5618007.1 Ig-like domain-containing protein [Kocuria sp.]MDN5654594.1 Ig-like domain-containing protein [Kocuria sp.]